MFLIHGDDKTKIIQNIQNFSKKYPEKQKIEINFNAENLSEFESIALTNDFFGNGFLVLVNVSGVRKFNDEKFAKICGNAAEENVFLFYSFSELTKANLMLKTLQKLKVQVMLLKDADKWAVFNFVDAVYLGDKFKIYKELKKLDEDAFYIISMLQYQLRNLTLLKFNSPLANSIAPFQKQVDR